METPNRPTTSDFDQAIGQFQQALGEFFRGNPEPAKMLMSHRDDVTLGNPFGPTARGWDQVSEVMDRAASNYREGSATSFEVAARYAGSELAYTVWVERFKARVGSKPEIVSGALRRTTIFRLEERAWKVVHSQADAITTARPAESIIPQ